MLGTLIAWLLASNFQPGNEATIIASWGELGEVPHCRGL